MSPAGDPEQNGRVPAGTCIGIRSCQMDIIEHLPLCFQKEWCVVRL
jgi:hypothetical protein